ncbi:PQQ-dependent sugar dehydrogenase [Catalinimonas niigatensis]|uniref:PQQ-dependent sugar dehydrogenase n=1 Tax=Catalinimonas niigatensis TaxID=1397264 RepID=UPI0026671F67|nr:PQQ-dependent sugar dehydrogenase [Catalinimonas niigatensis]WPP52056.1 PQQ-dependent sugar dehydrogenase [Catalinimonas niigatensis]
MRNLRTYLPMSAHFSTFYVRFCVLGIAGLLLLACENNSSNEDQTAQDEPQPEFVADEDNGSISLENGFSAYVVADSVGKTRHMAIRDNGDIYVKIREAQNGGGVLALRDTTGDGRADIQEYFGEEVGGTGIGIHDGYLYYASNTTVYRIKLDDEALSPSGTSEVVVEGFPEQNQHADKTLTFDGSGNMYVNVGAPSNACQEQIRTPGSPGQDPCPQLEKQAGIWRFDANQVGQTQEDGERYATGIRNAVAIEWNDNANSLYAMQHGRDQLSNLWPEYYTDSMSAELPAEEFLKVDQGDDFGWPFCYYDPGKEQKVLGPEYGGNGEEVGRCEGIEAPIMAFPAHWAPNSLVFYNGDQFPEEYQNGAFIAFHGSWNRAPFPMEGYNVAFVPMENGMPSGDYIRFADEFANQGGAIETPSSAEFRPTGLAIGPDGSLYISDDVKGRIWRVFYNDSNEMAMR